MAVARGFPSREPVTGLPHAQYRRALYRRALNRSALDRRAKDQAMPCSLKLVAVRFATYSGGR
jgi:hypothetical protein